MNKVPYVAVGNDELGKPINEGDRVRCPNCNKWHETKFGTDGQGRKTNLVVAVKCPQTGEVYLVGVDGKEIKNIE